MDRHFDSGLDRRVTLLCDAFVEALAAGSAPKIEDYLRLIPQPMQSLLLGELIEREIAFRRQHGQTPTTLEYIARFPQLDERDPGQETTAPLFGDLLTAESGGFSLAPDGAEHCPFCQQSLARPEQGATEMCCPACGGIIQIQRAEPLSTVDCVRQLANFQLLLRRGQGSFGTVWKARDTELDRLVAIKIPYASILSDPAYLERIEREARAVAQLRHPGIAHLNGIRTIAGVPMLIYDYIDGPSLKEYLKAHQMNFRETARIIAEIADALDYAHAQGVVHRDIKPANILMESFRTPDSGEASPESPARGNHGDAPHRATSPAIEGATAFSPATAIAAVRPVIVDFGLALRSEGEVMMTVEGQILGTVAYMSPEQAAGQGHFATSQTDIYCLGVVLYEMLSGKLPFGGSKASLLEQIQLAEPRPPRKINRKVPPDLETICLKAMHKVPALRFRSAAALARDLRNFLEGRPIDARRTGPIERTVRWCKRNPKLGLTSGAAAACLCAALMAGLAAYLQLAARYTDGQRSLSTSTLNDAVRLLDAGDAHTGLLLLGRSLELAPPGDRDLQRVIRTNSSAWMAQSHPLGAILPHGTGTVPLFAVNPNGQTFATADNTTAYLWDLGSKERRGAPLPHGDMITSLAFAPDGRILVTAGADHQVQMWDAATGERKGTPLGHDAGVNGVAYDAGGTRILTWSDDHTARIWDARTGTILGPPLLHSEKVKNAMFGNDGRLVLTTTADGTVECWSTDRYKRVQTWTGTEAAALSPNRPMLALVTTAHTLKMHDLGAPPRWETPGAHRDRVEEIVFASDGKVILTRSQDSTARLWDAFDGKAITPPLFHRRPVRAASLDPSGGFVLTGSLDNTARIWDAKTGLPVGLPLEHAGTVREIRLAPDGKTVFTTSEDGKVRAWKISEASQAVRLAHPAKVWAGAISPTSGRILTAWGMPVAPGSAQFWDAQLTGTVGPVLKHQSTIFAVVISADGRLAVTAGTDSVARIWNCATGLPIGDPLVHAGWVSGVAIDGMTRRLLTASLDTTAQVWELPSGKKGRSLPHRQAVLAAALSQNGRIAVTGCEDHRAYLWNLETGETPISLIHQQSVLGVALGGEDKLVATASEDTTARLWDATTGNQRLSLKHPDVVQCVALSPRTPVMATGCHDGFVRLWDTAAGKLLGPPLPHQACRSGNGWLPGRVWTVAFSSDGTLLLSGGDDGVGRLWSVPTPDSGAISLLVRRVECITGMELDAAGAARELDLDRWNELRRRMSRN
jgi:WD40 repeat protein/serine/threonine protein kinase